MMLSRVDKCLLILMARQRISGHLLKRYKPSNPISEIPDSLQTKCGTFVSLYVDDHLRGCIGTFSEEYPLHTNVKNMALSAATTDSRFLPVTRGEVSSLKIEISVLSPRQPINGPDEIILGKHGIYIQDEMNKGTLLPQVPVNQGWNVEQFLGNCSKYKAGLGWEGWRSAELYTYEAIVFNSEEISSNC